MLQNKLHRECWIRLCLDARHGPSARWDLQLSVAGELGKARSPVMGTETMRVSGFAVATHLFRAGAPVVVHDPAAMENARSLQAGSGNVCEVGS